MPHPPTTEKWIDVDLSRQTATAYSGSTPVKTVHVSTGTAKHPTVVGSFRNYVKVRGSRAEGDYYRLPSVPNIMYFYRGCGLHGTYWHRNFGQPMSHGCVNLVIFLPLISLGCSACARTRRMALTSKGRGAYNEIGELPDVEPVNSRHL